VETPREDEASLSVVEDQRVREARREWVDLYGIAMADKLDVDRRYALMRVGRAEFAYADFDAYVRALGQVWDVGLVPHPLPSALGSELPRLAPQLRGVDADLADLTLDEVRRRTRFR
jgi:hypothetical protein